MKRTLNTLTFILFSLIALAEGGKSQIPLADPYILIDDGKYYAYGTHDANGIRCYTSDDLRSWVDAGLALNKENTTEKKWFWAPEVYRIADNEYIMYFSANEHLFAAKATSPKGPFKQVGTYQMNNLLGSEKCIDSHVFFDDNGKAYIFFVRFTDGNCIWQAELDGDYITPKEGTLRKCFAVSQDWENKLGRVNEGPNVIKIGKRYFLTYSGNDYRSQDYAVGYATTTNIATGTWTKYSANPILRRWDDLVGTGHHSLFYDKEGILRIVFHAHYSTEEVGPRLMYIGTMQTNASRIYMSNEPVIRPTLAAKPYNPELVTKQWGFENGGITTVDLNNDGYLDLVAGGSGNDVTNDATDDATSRRNTFAYLYLPTTHRWSKASATTPFKVADSPSIIPCDINNDGNMDIIAFERVGNDTAHEAYTGNYGCEGIFLGTGKGTFTTPGLSFCTPTGEPCDFDVRGPSSAEVIDIDNDGRLDIVCAGMQGEDSYNVILHNMGSDDKGILNFIVEPYETEYRLHDAIIQVADMNNDGYQDFVISSMVDGIEGQVRFTDLYLNDSTSHGRFVRQDLGTADGQIKRKSNGSLQLADLNDDGWTDIYLAGLGEASSGESTTRQRIYLNQCQATPSFTAISSEMTLDYYNTSSCVSSSTGIIDWNGDGFYDIFIGGFRGNVKTSTGQLYINDGTGRMKRFATIPGCTSASIAFPDWNGDGRKDFVLNGLCTDVNYLTSEQQGRNTILCYNLNPTPSRPDAPTNCEATVNEDGSVTLSWMPAESARKCFTYEVFIADSLGSPVNSTPAFIGGDKDGIRKANQKGRVGCTNQWEFHPTSPGRYTWGVQTVDASYTGSVFAEGPSFTIKEESGTGIISVQSNEEATSIYNIEGKSLDTPVKGINIITKGGSTRKILK